MKKLRKGMIVVLAVLMAAAMITGCGGDNIPEEMTQPVKIAALNGPTGMGMVQLMDQTDKYEITVYQAPSDAAAKIINGEVDVAAVPSNMAAIIYNKTEGQIQAISPITMGVLYIVGNDTDIKELQDLKGKTIIASGQGGAPEYILQKVLENAGLTMGEDVKVEWLSNHTEVNIKLCSQKGTVAMLPEPFVSVALASQEADNSQIFDLNELWKEATGEELPMGVLIARKSFIEEREGDLTLFLYDYGKSVDFVNEGGDEAAALITEKGFIGKKEIAASAIERCGIVLFDGDDREEGRAILKKFNEILFEMEPASIGGKMPDEEFYY